MSRKLPSFWIFLWISILLALIGWGGLVYLISETLPYLGQRWLFYVFLVLALSGTAMPVIYFLNRRFPANPPVDGAVVVREAIWVGVYGSLLAWLQLGRVLTPGLAVVLMVGLVLAEFLLRMGEGSVWKPTPDDSKTQPVNKAVRSEASHREGEDA